MSGGDTVRDEVYNEADDDGYVGYVPKAVNLGGGLLAGAFLAFFVAYGIILPLLVVMGGRRDAERKALEEIFIIGEKAGGDDIEGKQERESGDIQPENDLVVAATRGQTTKHKTDKHKTDNDTDASQTTCIRQRTEDEVSCSGRSTASRQSSSTNRSSEMSSAVAAILDHPRVPKNKTQRRRRRIKEKQLLDASWTSNSPSSKSNSNNQMPFSSNSQDPTMVSLLQGIHPGAIPVNPVAAAAPGSSNGSEGEDEFLEETVSRPDFSATLPPSGNMVGYAHLQQPGDFAKLGVLDKITTISAWE